jgi:hypothetical protein
LRILKTIPWHKVDIKVLFNNNYILKFVLSWYLEMNFRRWRWNGITSERNRWSITWDQRATTFSVEIQSMSEMISSSLKMTHVIDNSTNQLIRFLSTKLMTILKIRSHMLDTCKTIQCGNNWFNVIALLNGK